MRLTCLKVSCSGVHFTIWGWAVCAKRLLSTCSQTQTCSAQTTKCTEMTQHWRNNDTLDQTWFQILKCIGVFLMNIKKEKFQRTVLSHALFQYLNRHCLLAVHLTGGYSELTNIWKWFYIFLPLHPHLELLPVKQVIDQAHSCPAKNTASDGYYGLRYTQIPPPAFLHHQFQVCRFSCMGSRREENAGLKCGPRRYCLQASGNSSPAPWWHSEQTNLTKT